VIIRQGAKVPGQRELCSTVSPAPQRYHVQSGNGLPPGNRALALVGSCLAITCLTLTGSVVAGLSSTGSAMMGFALLVFFARPFDGCLVHGAVWWCGSGKVDLVGGVDDKRKVVGRRGISTFLIPKVNADHDDPQYRFVAYRARGLG
jgi:hypothetical protein